MVERRKDNKRRVLKEGEYQRANGTFEYRFRDKSGKRNSVYAKTLEELREKEKDVTKKSVFGLKTTAITLNDLYGYWLKTRKGFRDTTMKNYTSMYRCYIKNGIGLIKLSLIRKSDIRALYVSLIESNELAPLSVKILHNLLYQIFQIAVDDEYLFRNPADNAMKDLLQMYRDKIAIRHALTKEEQTLFEDMLYNDRRVWRWKPFFLIILYTGMRIGEISGLTWKDINFSKNTISINHSLSYLKRQGEKKSSLYIGYPKTEAGKRTIPFDDKVRSLLLEEKQNQMKQGIHSSVVIDGYSNFVFVCKNGKPRTQITYSEALKRVIAWCNIKQLEKGSKIFLPDFSCHHLRHTFATRLCEANVNPKVIQTIMGHSSIQTTLDIYAEVDEETKRKEIENFFQENGSLF